MPGRKPALRTAPCLAKIHLGCSEELSREHLTIPALLPEEPETPDTPATPGDGADGDGGYTPAVTVIEDQEVPLAGLLPLHQLLEELRLHEEIPEAELPADFKWLDHEHAQAICWASRSSWWLTPGRSPLIPTRSLP